MSSTAFEGNGPASVTHRNISVEGTLIMAELSIA